MPQSRASSRSGNDEVWDQSRDWGFDDRSLRPRSFPRPARSEDRPGAARSDPRRARPAPRRTPRVADTPSSRRKSEPFAEPRSFEEPRSFAEPRSFEEPRTFAEIRPYVEPRSYDELSPLSAAPPLRESVATPGRRTIVITGRGSERYRPPEVRRPTQRQHLGLNPDRIAMWAVLLGIVLLLVAATSSHAAVLSAHQALAALVPPR